MPTTDRLTVQANIDAQWKKDIRQATAGPDAEHLARVFYVGARSLLLAVKRIADDLSPEDGAQALAAIYAALDVAVTGPTDGQADDVGSRQAP